MICEKCGVENFERFKFCTGCGERLKAPLPVEPERSAVSPESGLRRRHEQPKLHLSQILDKKYRLGAVIETAETSATYKASCLKTGEEIAVKIFNLESDADSALADQLMRQTKIVARFKHPNVAAIYDFDVSENDFFYIAAELAAGQSLRQIIKQQGMLPPQIVSVIAAQVCAALDEAHRQNIVHRDIKPENIIVNTATNDLPLKVVNFGLTEMNGFGASVSPQPNDIGGSPHYMSPEQCLGEEIDGRSNVYSFGVVLYEMLGGAPPFDAPVPATITDWHITKPPAPLRSLNPNIPPPVEAVVRRSLQKQRKARQQTAANLARELRTAVYISGLHR